MSESNGWDECKKDVYNRFDQVDKNIDRLTTTIDTMTAKINRYVTENEVFKKEIKIKASFWGAISGSIPILISFLIGLLIYLIQKK